MNHRRIALWLFAFALVALRLAWPSRPESSFALRSFGELPTLLNGRLQPLDTVARTTLLQLQGRQRVRTAEGAEHPPLAWLLDVLFRPEQAETYSTFELVHPELLALLSLTPEQGEGSKRFSYRQLKPGLRLLEQEGRRAEEREAPERTAFQRAVLQLRSRIVVYQKLHYSFAPPDDPSFLAKLDGPLSNTERAESARAAASLAALGTLRPIPTPSKVGSPSAWRTFGAAAEDSLREGPAPGPGFAAWRALGLAWQRQDPAAFATAVATYRTWLNDEAPDIVRTTRLEEHFQAAQPFALGQWLFVLAFLLAVVSWLRWPILLGELSLALLGAAFALTTLGIGFRMMLEGRPPVTNLYSSALVVGWGAVALCLVWELRYRGGLACAAGGLLGFATLLIAHHLSLSGDTLEMMRAVLDSNFWLATHVVTVTVGYSATFLAGALGLIYVLRGLTTRTLDAATATALGRMIYGTVCFGLLLSFVGTVLGGIWADQSWGRFWGWDPKENGALLVVLWNAIVLHAKATGRVRERGMALLAIGGNAITAWSWFGVNMLGVGLHSYGFMDAAFWWLVGFATSQGLVLTLALLPDRCWRSPSAIDPSGAQR